MFTATLFTIAEKVEVTHMPTDRKMDQQTVVLCIQRMKYYSPSKKAEKSDTCYNMDKPFRTLYKKYTSDKRQTLRDSTYMSYLEQSN